MYTNYLKKATIIFSFILITVFSAGSYFLHQLYLKSYKKDFKAYISKYKEQSAFSTITINPSELYANSKTITWEDEFKEVIYNGVLYDVGRCVVFRHQLAMLHTKVAWAYAGMAIRPIGSPDRNAVS